MTGLNTIFIDDRDPFAHGFVVKLKSARERVIRLRDAKTQHMPRLFISSHDLRYSACLAWRVIRT